MTEQCLAGFPPLGRPVITIGDAGGESPVALGIVASIVDVLVLDLDRAAIGAGSGCRFGSCRPTNKIRDLFDLAFSPRTVQISQHTGGPDVQGNINPHHNLTLDRLIQMGMDFIERVQDDFDRRIRKLSLTQKGKEVLQ
jgi:hypothetical protein